MVEGLKVKMVILSTGAPDDPNALLIKKKQFRFEPNSNILCLSSGLRADWRIDDLNIFFTLNDKTVICLFDVGKSGRKDSQAFKIEDDFFSWLESRDESLTLVEIGSRARSGNTFRDRIPGRHQFVGVDLMEGTNVDVVADAHSLSLQIEHNSIDAVFGVSVFEHLAMPWKVAIELNTIMRMGARGMFVTHQAWPLHDDPFDFWRYSKDSWHAIFNRSSGFKIIEAAIGDRAQIFAELQTQDTFFPSDCFCYLVSSVLIEKTSDTELSWDVPLDEIYQGEYPE
ncbi:MAG: hypothetical protein O7C75_16255 [Verrucomicrobia bacterium]|nr:hypothetical protein [Verrucomicrobiota bacterium]